MADGSGSTFEILAPGVLARAVPGCGVAAFAARAFRRGDIVLAEEAVFFSAVCAPRRANAQLLRALHDEVARRRLPDFEPSGHLGALVALRDLGPKRCQALLASKCSGEGAPPSPRKAKAEAGVLRFAVSQGLVPQSAASFPPREYAKLRMAIQLNGFRFNLDAKEGDFGYDRGEALFDRISRLNHSCQPNVEFNLTWDNSRGNVVNTITAMSDICEGEELNISYLPLRLCLAVEERRRQLLEHWEFVCRCPRCEAEGGPPKPTEPRPARVPTVAHADQAPQLDGDSSSEGVGFDDLRDPDDA
ncbi:smyd5 [Symbiodinium sp. CCMP2592]|nr:smyd5 [Symbiodinium sp. CCMP2592]